MMAATHDPKRRPTHPGAILREDVLPALGLTQTECAQRLGVSRLTVSDLLHEKRGYRACCRVKRTPDNVSHPHGEARELRLVASRHHSVCCVLQPVAP